MTVLKTDISKVTISEGGAVEYSFVKPNDDGDDDDDDDADPIQQPSNIEHT